MFWILCLLVGSITCTPVHKDYGSQGFSSAATEPADVPLPYVAGNWRRVTSDAGGTFPKPSRPNQSSEKVGAPDVSGSHSGYSSTNTGFKKPYYSPESSNYGVNVASYSSGYDGSNSGGFGSSASGSVAAPQDEAGNSGSSNADTVELVFRDVSALEPIYSFSSRSRYQRGRAVFAQTRYIPGEPAPPVMAVSRDVRKWL